MTDRSIARATGMFGLACVVLREPCDIVAETARHHASRFDGIEPRSRVGNAREQRKAESESQYR